MTRSRILLGLLLILGLTSWWLSRDQADRYRPKEGAHTADYYAENMTTIEMGKDGLPERRLIATKMTHFGDDGSTDLVKPHMMLFEEARPPWIIRSETGWISDDRRDIWLRGHVNIDREADTAVKPYHMVTQELHVKREPDYAETDQEVFVISDQERVEAVGMQAWLEPEVRVKLLSQVRGRYVKE